MGTSIGSLSEMAVAVVLIAMFAMVFVVAHRALKKMQLFGDTSSWIVALCVALLSIMGLLRFLGSPGPVASRGGEPREIGGLLDIILMPYTVLALAILLVLLLLGASKVLRGREPSHFLKGARSRGTCTKPCAWEGGIRPQWTRPVDLPERRQIVDRKDGEMLRQPEGGR